MVTEKPTSVVFIGAGPVAAKSLELLAKNFTIEAVITKPRPAHHRGNAPVVDLAESLDLPILSASNKSELDKIISQNSLKSKLAVLIDFGIIVSKKVIDYFPLGVINSHFSVLPDLRGADPITFAILSGQKQTGVSLMLVAPKLDEGQLISYGEYEIPMDITTPELTEVLINLSDALLNNEIPRLISGEARSAPQSVTGRPVTHSRKLTKDDGIIDWHKPAIQLEREVRAYTGWPGSRTSFGDKEVTITKSHVVKTSGKAGSITATKDSLTVVCGEDSLAIDQIKPSGKASMPIQAFMSGYGRLFN